MSEQKTIRYPSFAVGWDKNGNPQVIAVGDAQEALDGFKAERDKSNFSRVAYFRKVRPDKARTTGLRQKTTVSIDLSEFDGKPLDPKRVEALKAEAVAANAIIEESTAPKKSGKSK